ncbi:PA2169 family four-helix-bundle protein [Daejeonella sp.]|uniref:ferritin-like domain-containing protein n=1 Tax=Daejeonella sp. TaxID=2805397 RepID=UPI0027171E28|nr:PA2169 family four-helix-bundle protein [Daejeonella sp.]MDO8992460.1 PA2169 family four-helix-bundle protein [Daejeonella sp.]MDP2413389.1 PA2169 family four-helix-bundle protein [Daejeonella sp.]
MENSKTIDVLNTLITINNDRIEGYETASKETEEQDLKILFAQLSSTSQKCNQELNIEVNKLGGTPAEGTMVSGKFFRVWMDVKAALTGKDRKAILNSCEYGEDVAKNTYENVLKNDTEHLSPELQTLIQEQHTLLVTDHDKVKALRDALIEA